MPVSISASTRDFDQTLGESTTITDLWPQEYEIRVWPRSGGGVDFHPKSWTSKVVRLDDGESAAVTVEYSPDLGDLDVVVSGLPPGIDADVAITGPDGFRAQLPGTTLLEDLLPGDYTVRSALVTSGGVTYSPDPLIQTAPVLALQSSTATVTYTVSARTPVTIEDDFTVGDQWIEIVHEATGGAQSTVENRPNGGVVSGYRHMTHAFNGQGDIEVRHLYTGGGYDPSSEGAIDHINYSEWRIQLDLPFPNAAIGSYFLVIQDGVAYLSPISGSTIYQNQVWERGESSSLGPSDFSPAGLDFSDAGAELFFGFLRTNSTGSGGTWTTTHGIDDWSVEIVRVQG